MPNLNYVYDGQSIPQGLYDELADTNLKIYFHNAYYDVNAYFPPQNGLRTTEESEGVSEVKLGYRPSYRTLLDISYQNCPDEMSFILTYDSSLIKIDGVIPDRGNVNLETVNENSVRVHWADSEENVVLASTEPTLKIQSSSTISYIDFEIEYSVVGNFEITEILCSDGTVNNENDVDNIARFKVINNGIIGIPQK